MNKRAKLLRILLLCGVTALSGQTTPRRILYDFRIDANQAPNIQDGSKLAPEVQRQVLSTLFPKYLTAETQCDPANEGQPIFNPQQLEAERKSGQMVASIEEFADGSFTAAGHRQTAYFIGALECFAWSPANTGTNELAIFEGTRLILKVNQKVGLFGGHANALVAVADVNNDGIDELLLEAVGGHPEIQGDASLVSFRGGEPHVMKEFNEVYFNGCLGISFARVTASVITYTPKQFFVDQYEAPCIGEGVGGNLLALAEFKRVHGGSH